MKQEEEKPYSRRFILILITAVTFLNPFTGSAINLALPAIGAEFSADAAMLAWIASAYLLSSVIFLLPAGRLGDSRGRVTVFLLGVVVYTAGSLLTIFTPTLELLLVFRFLQGIGGAMIYANSVALITHLYPPGKRGTAIGLNVTATYAGLSLGPFLGGALTQFFGWRSIFILTMLLAVPSLLYAGKYPAFLNERRDERFDVPGIVISSALILCLFLGLAWVTAPAGVALLVAVVLLAVILIRVEQQQPCPILPVSLLTSNQVFAASNGAALINYSATYAVGFLLSLYLQYVQGYEPIAAGTLLLIQPVIMVFVAPISGRLADRIQPGLVASVGMALSGAALFGFSFLTLATPVAAIVALLVLLGVGVGLFSSPNTTAIMGSVTKQDYGCASAMTAMMRSLGMMLSMGAVLVVFAVIMGSTVVTPAIFPEFLLSLRLVFFALAVLSAFGVVLSLKRNKL
ncbi:MFS transporter [Methanoculleus sp.]|uniref:MFS transporter n=1 Tax=Methanoculleus sp. TaxID=90427 RepID=UPI002FC68887